MAKSEQASVVVAGETYVMPGVIKGLIDSLQIFNNVLIDENDALKTANEECAKHIKVLKQRVDQLEKNNHALKHGFITSSKQVLETPKLVEEAMKTQRSITAIISRQGRTQQTNKVKLKALELYDKQRGSFASDTDTAEAIFSAVKSYANSLVPKKEPSQTRFYKTLLGWLSERKR